MPRTILKTDPKAQEYLATLNKGLAAFKSAKTVAEEKATADVVAIEVAKQLAALKLAGATTNDNYAYAEGAGLIDAEDAAAKNWPHTYGLVHKSAGSDDRVQEMHDWNDTIYLTSKILGCPPEQTRTFQERKQEMTELGKALNTATAAEGGNFVPTDLSASVIDLMALELVVAGLFPEIPMPSNPFLVPQKTGRSSAYYVNESTSDNPALFRASQPTIGQLTLTAKKIAVRVNLSDELTEDGIISMLEFIREDIAQAVSRGWEEALVDGDTAATHQDADVTSPDDPRKAIIGLRKLVNTAAKLDVDEDGTGTLDIEDFRLIRGLMTNAAGDAVYAARPNQLAWLTSVKGSLWIMNKLKDYVTTPDKFPQATILTGWLGKFDGIDLFAPEQYRSDFNAAGVRPSTAGTQTNILCVNRQAHVIGVKRPLKIESDRVIGADQNIMVATTRRDFQPRFPTTENFIGAINSVVPA